MIIKALIAVAILFSAPVSFLAISRGEEGHVRKAFTLCAVITAVEALAIILLASSI